MNIICRSKLTYNERKTVRRKVPLDIQTASGITVAIFEATVYVKDFDEHITAILLDDTPAIISFCILCVEKGWSYLWDPGDGFPIVSKGKRVIICQLVHHVPNITVGRLMNSSQPVNQDNPKVSTPPTASGDAGRRNIAQKEQVSSEVPETGRVSKKKSKKKR